MNQFLVRIPYSRAHLANHMVLGNAREHPLMQTIEDALAESIDVQKDNKTVYGLLNNRMDNILWFRFSDQHVSVSMGFDGIKPSQYAGSDWMMQGEPDVVEIVLSNLNSK